MIWSVFDRVPQSNSRFNAMDILVVTVHSVRMSVRFGKHAIKSRSRSLSVMEHLKHITVEVKAEEICIFHTLIVAIAAKIKGRAS